MNSQQLGMFRKKKILSRKYSKCNDKKKVIEILVESGKTQDIASKGFLASFGIF